MNHFQPVPRDSLPGSVADHPRARGRKAFGAAFDLLDQARRPGRTTAAAGPMRSPVFADGLRRVG